MIRNGISITHCFSQISQQPNRKVWLALSWHSKIFKSVSCRSVWTKLWKPITSSFSQEQLKKTPEHFLLSATVSQQPNRTKRVLYWEGKKIKEKLVNYRLHRSYRSSSEERQWRSSHRWCTETRRTSAFPSETARKITNYSLEPLFCFCFTNLLLSFSLPLKSEQKQQPNTKHFHI